jgi:acetyl esterase/lipase/predicted methyltransferase
LSGAAEPAPEGRHAVRVRSKASIVHLGSLDSFDRTVAGTAAARLVLRAVESHNPEEARGAARQALRIYKAIIPNENFGGEYTALQWLCEYLVASPAQQKEKLANRFDANFYHFFADNHYAVLREYVRRKYRLEKAPLWVDNQAELRHRYHEDFILFNNPRRAQWEKSSRMLAVLGLKKGDVVADVGAGPGFFTFQFAELVGDKGKVYATDTNDRHRRYVNGVIKQFGITNVQTVNASATNIGVPRGVRVDCVFLCSLYHIIYCTFTEAQRKDFIDSIKATLTVGGNLVIVDNALVENRSLPYHGPYIAKELIIAQLEGSGFRLAATHQFIPQRYLLVFKVGKAPARAPEGTAGEGILRLDSATSLVQFPQTAPCFEFTPDAQRAARDFYKALDEHNREAARSALAHYTRELIPREPAGHEYSAFAWYCDYLLASPREKLELLKDKFVAAYFQRLGGDDFSTLKKYVRARYQLSDPKSRTPDVPQEQLLAWHEFIVFNNPRRQTWEKTGKVLKLLNLKPGTAIADIGCGPGYYTFQFAEQVGKEGRVYAADTSDEALNAVRTLAAKVGAKNITPVKSSGDDSKLPPDSVDVIYLCSVYHAVYLTTMEHVRERFLTTLKKALRKGGRLVIADNEVAEHTTAYYGPRIDRRLIVEQLRHYGFKLVEQRQFIPQRYVLVFCLAQAGSEKWGEQPATAILVPPDVLYDQDLEYSSPSKGPSLRLDVARPARGKKPSPAVVLFAGGPWLSTGKEGNRPLQFQLAQRGYVAVSVAYRNGTQYPFPCQINDAKRAVRWLRANATRFGIDKKRVAAVGYSAGGNLACLLGMTTPEDGLEGEGKAGPSSRVKAVVSFYGVSDLTRLYEDHRAVKPLTLEKWALRIAMNHYLGGAPTRFKAAYQKASAITYTRKGAAPTLLIHGTADQRVPLSQSRLLATALKKVGGEVTLVEIKGAGHNFGGAYEKSANETLFKFLNRHLQPLEMTDNQ